MGCMLIVRLSLCIGLHILYWKYFVAEINLHVYEIHIINLFVIISLFHKLVEIKADIFQT